MILSSWTVQNQAIGQIWPSYSLPPSALEDLLVRVY